MCSTTVKTLPTKCLQYYLPKLPMNTHTADRRSTSVLDELGIF
jgi:hypothetical protein